MARHASSARGGVAPSLPMALGRPLATPQPCSNFGGLENPPNLDPLCNWSPCVGRVSARGAVHRVMEHGPCTGRGLFGAWLMGEGATLGGGRLGLGVHYGVKTDCPHPRAGGAGGHGGPLFFVFSMGVPSSSSSPYGHPPPASWRRGKKRSMGRGWGRGRGVEVQVNIGRYT